MELSSGQQRALFVAIVVVLGGLGIYLIGPGGHHGASASPGQSPSPKPSTAAPGVAAPSSAPATRPATPAGTAATGSASTAAAGGQSDIYNWLPFTQQDLTSAAKTTIAFANDYGTWSYTESAVAYVAKMKTLITPELANTLKATYAPPGALAQRKSQKQVSTGSAGITQVKAYGPGTITFDVTIEQKLTTSNGIKTDTSSYAVTCVQDAAGWTVNDVELATAGNFGAANP
ncbi:MAG TPA: hypothetical protein VG164_03575 [Trebonia sp.]|jgi:hypothetical protein|nr:hypothetical protein [Trebonia sp.]